MIEWRGESVAVTPGWAGWTARQDQQTPEVPGPMDNHERHTQLRQARENALVWAERAESAYRQGSTGLEESVAMAHMWASVAEALKVGEQTSDAA